jgi:acetamidase/formamidase
MHSYHIDSTHTHITWSNALKPVVTVNSGDIVSFDLVDGSSNQLNASSTAADVQHLDYSLIDPATGPIYVNGAEPGDVLVVKFLELKPADYGWTAVPPNFGLLSDEFTEPGLKVFDLKEFPGYTVFKKGIHIPIRPFLGIVGVAPEEPGEFSTIPPRETGGNIDCKYITEGTTLYLPIKVRGALFSCGDGHAAQGDGEVCGTAIETPMKAKMQLSIEKGKPYISCPHYCTAEAKDNSVWPSRGDYATVGVDSDLREAARKSVRAMIAWLCAERSLIRVEAYMLISIVGDLKIVEAVDMPNYAVACSLPLKIFV